MLLTPLARGVALALLSSAVLGTLAPVPAQAQTAPYVFKQLLSGGSGSGSTNPGAPGEPGTPPPAELQTPALGTFSVPSVAADIGSFTLMPPSSTSGGTWTYSSSDTSVLSILGTVATVHSAGSVIITADQLVTSTHQAASTSAGFEAIAVNPVIGALVLPASVPATSEPFELQPPTSPSDGAWTYTSSAPANIQVDGNTVTILQAGSSTITATQAAGSKHTAASTSATLTATAVAPTHGPLILPTNSMLDTATFTLVRPTSDSDGAWTFSSGNTDIATVNATTGVVTLRDPGTVIFNAGQAAHGKYTALTTTSSALTVTPTVAFTSGGLTWSRISSTRYGHAAAVAKCPAYGAGWRLPTREELTAASAQLSALVVQSASSTRILRSSTVAVDGHYGWLFQTNGVSSETRNGWYDYWWIACVRPA